MNSPFESSAFRIHLVATLLAGSSALFVAAHLQTAAMRLDLKKAPWPVPVALIAWTAAVVVLPRHASYSIFLAIRLFGNHPGGPLMELLNLHLAATTLGLTFRAWRQRRPPPGGTLWGSALLVLLSVGLALVATLPHPAGRPGLAAPKYWSHG